MLVPDLSTTPREVSDGIHDFAELIRCPGAATSIARCPGCPARSGPGAGPPRVEEVSERNLRERFVVDRRDGERYGVTELAVFGSVVRDVVDVDNDVDVRSEYVLRITGTQGSVEKGDTYEFDGTDWVNLPKDPLILKRTRYFLSFVRAFGRTFMFGGQQVAAPLPTRHGTGARQHSGSNAGGRFQ